MAGEGVSSSAYDYHADAVWECEQAKVALGKLAAALAVMHFYSDYVRVSQMEDDLEHIFVALVNDTQSA